MISEYARSGKKLDAFELFKRVPVRNLFSWNALISGLVQSSSEVDAVHFFFFLLTCEEKVLIW